MDDDVVRKDLVGRIIAGVGANAEEAVRLRDLERLKTDFLQYRLDLEELGGADGENNGLMGETVEAITDIQERIRELDGKYFRPTEGEIAAHKEVLRGEGYEGVSPFRRHYGGDRNDDPGEPVDA
jgi:hypothetical protein